MGINRHSLLVLLYALLFIHCLVEVIASKNANKTQSAKSSKKSGKDPTAEISDGKLNDAINKQVAMELTKSPLATTKKPPKKKVVKKTKTTTAKPGVNNKNIPNPKHWGPTKKGTYTKEGIYIEVMHKPENCGRISQKGDVLTTEYIGTFPNGEKFDSTYDRKEPMRYRLGDGQVIEGDEIATTGMCAGEIRRSIIPAKYAYGDKDYAQIPGGSILQFETNLTDLMENPENTFGDSFKIFETMM